jgi:hypothetical protein
MSAGLPVELVQHSRVLIADHDVAADCHADWSLIQDIFY